MNENDQNPDPQMTTQPQSFEAPGTVNTTVNNVAAQPEIPQPEPTPTVEQSPIENTNTPLPEVEKKKSKLPIVLLLLLVVIGVGAYFAYKMLFSNPVEKTITSFFNEYKSKNVLNKIYKETATITASSSKEDYAFLKNYSLNTEISYDKDFNILSKLIFNEKNSPLINATVYYANNKLYFKLPDVSDKTYYMDLNLAEELDMNSNIKLEDIDYLIQRFELGLKKALKNETLNTKSIEVGLGEKTLKVDYKYYKIDKANIKRFTSNLLSMFEDEKSLNILSSLADETVAELKEDLKDVPKDAEEECESEITFGVYTTGFLNKVVGVEFDSVPLEKQSSESKINMYYIEDGNKATAKIRVDEEEYVTLDKNNDNYVIKLFEDKKEVSKINITQKSDNQVTVETSYQDMVDIKSDVKVEEIGKIEALDTTKAVDITKISDAEMNQLTNKLYEKLQKSELFKILQNTDGKGLDTTATN